VGFLEAGTSRTGRRTGFRIRDAPAPGDRTAATGTPETTQEPGPGEHRLPDGQTELDRFLAALAALDPPPADPAMDTAPIDISGLIHGLDDEQHLGTGPTSEAGIRAASDHDDPTVMQPAGTARRPHIEIDPNGIPWSKSDYSAGMGACVEITVIHLRVSGPRGLRQPSKNFMLTTEHD
jgi:hypothetical protein